jgi:hypothetical protein
MSLEELPMEVLKRILRSCGSAKTTSAYGLPQSGGGGQNLGEELTIKGWLASSSSDHRWVFSGLLFFELLSLSATSKTLRDKLSADVVWRPFLERLDACFEVGTAVHALSVQCRDPMHPTGKWQPRGILHAFSESKLRLFTTSTLQITICTYFNTLR